MSGDPMMTTTDALRRLADTAVVVRVTVAPGSEMVWRRWGKGPDLVLLHGGAGSWMHWVRNIEFLARNRAVWVPDMPGFGDSDLPAEGLDADAIAPMVLDAAGKVLQGRPFDLVGFSFGGLVSAYIAAARPGRLRRLVLVSVAAMGMMGDFSSLRSLRGVSDEHERKDVLRHNLKLVMLHRQESIDDLALAVQEAGGTRERVRGRKLVLKDHLADLAARWDCAAYGIWGEEDAIYRGNLERLRSRADALPLRRYEIIPQAGHWVQYEESGRFNDLLTRFLAAEHTGSGA